MRWVARFEVTPLFMFLYLVFFLVSWLILMKIYGFSTYHKFFKKAGLVLAVYGCLVGYLLFAFQLHQYFVWQAGLTLGLLLWKYFGMAEEGKKLEALGLHKLASADSLELSLERTKKYYILSSLIYLSTFIISYLYLFNM